MTIAIERSAFHPRVFATPDYDDFCETAITGDFDAVIWDRWVPGKKGNNQREKLIKAIQSHWRRVSRNTTADINGISLEITPMTRTIKPVTTRQTPVMREFNYMATAFHNITGYKHVKMSMIPRSNNPMPTRRVRDCPILVCEWLSVPHKGYIVDPDFQVKGRQGEGIPVFSGNWLYVTPRIPIDIVEKSFDDKRTKRLTVLLEPSQSLI